MTMRALLLLVCATQAALLASHATVSASTHVTLRHVRSHPPPPPPPPHAAPPASAPQAERFHVSGSRASFQQLLAPAVRAELGLDVWHVHREGKTLWRADVHATPAAVHALSTGELDVHFAKGPVKGVVHKKAHWSFQVKAAATSVADAIARDRVDVASCLYASKGYLSALAGLAKYSDSAFFDCFHPHDQVLEFFDTLAEANRDLVEKVENVSVTYEGRAIPAYKLSTSSTSIVGRALQKKSLYTQALLHAREWQAGASTHYAMARLIDDLRAHKKDVVALFEEYDWYFVPVVNIDGYKYSWEQDRYWRTNRHASNGYDGVDLNRNFPPDEYFNPDPAHVDAETNPGAKPLSEPESAGIYEFVMGLDRLAGVVDMHGYGALVLRPFSDENGEPAEPFGSAMKKLGDGVRDAMSSKQDGVQYVSEPSGALYPAYGCFDDAFYRATNFTVPSITIEVEGDDFIAPQKAIRTAGKHVYRGLRRFATEALTYAEFIAKLPKNK